MPRVLGLDVGNRRIGIALTDENRTTVQPYATLARTNRRNDLRYFDRLMRLRPFAEIVIGLPLYPSGDQSPQAAQSQAYAGMLREHFALPTHLWDERMSTAEAHRYLDATDYAKTQRKQVIDQLAAVLILENWLAAQNTMPG